ncbi:hypothetical protein IE81DRAFT_126006 [Ceraceosorus guamensis]|uniref:Uncharacterized protein n=1 Tax=Ceraceosorus guamensis TaxID=1522189 RepID=A0A316WAL8_9BASI|nr:hypothetical protein IE81DRAFT_126006 [Ceraceosorus guamensis]PWN45771.1 hypothetical protein IE81DRAFT_126006 [Ceraceosorus guamensis]
MSSSTPSSSGRSSPAPRSDASSATSAGAVPIPGNSKSGSSQQQQQQQQQQGGSPFESGAFGQRRGSAPASAFLAPRFWNAATSTGGAPGGIMSYAHGAYGTSPNSSGHHHHHHHHHQQAPGATFDVNGVPRRTSFGHSLTGGRLSALAALGMAPMQSPPIQSSGLPPATSKPRGTAASPERKMSSSSSSATEVLPPLSASSTPISSPALKSTKSTTDVPTANAANRRKDRVFFLPGPDGLCVESRRRRPSEA